MEPLGVPGVNWYGSHGWWLLRVDMLFSFQHGAMVLL